MGTQLPLPKKGGRAPQFLTHVYCGQTAGWFKITKVGICPGHIVLHGDQALHRKKGTAPNFRPMFIVAKRSPISSTAEHLLGEPLQITVRPVTGPLSCLFVCNVGVLWPNGWMDQDATWYGGRPLPRRHCVSWGLNSPTERGTATIHFSADVYCGQTVAHLGNCRALVSFNC